VDALVAMVGAKLDGHSMVAHGSGFRSVVPILMLTLGLMVVGVDAYVHKGRVGINTLIVACLLALVGMVLPLWPGLLLALFPGFVMYRGEVSILRRYSAGISFFGVVLTILIPICQGLIGRVRKAAHDGGDPGTNAAMAESLHTAETTDDIQLNR